MKNIFIIDTYPVSPKQEEILIQCIKKLKFLNWDILLCSHAPVKPEIQEMVDYYIYDKNNTFLPPSFTPFNWFYLPNDLKIEILNGGHTLPICRNMFNSINFVKDNYYDFFFFLEFDNLFSEEDLLKLDSFRKSMIENNQELLFFRPESFRECDSYVYETLMFGGCPKFFLDKFQPPRNFTEWLRVSMGYTLELSFYEQFSPYESQYLVIPEHCVHVFNTSEINKFRYRLIDSMILHNKIVESEPQIFIFNEDLNSGVKKVNIYKNNQLYKSLNLNYKDWFLEKTYYDDSIIKIDIFSEDDILEVTKTFSMSESLKELYESKAYIKYNN
jgi:hypothetical protein